MPSLGLGLGTQYSNRALYSVAARDYFRRLDTAGVRVNSYDRANARLIDRLVGNGGNFWPDSGAFCAMAGYLYPGNGADLIPLKDGHDAGTLNAFVTGDWNAVTGLKGDGSTKYVDSNRNNNADGQDDQAMGVYVTQGATNTTSSGFFGGGVNQTGSSNAFINGSNGISVRSRTDTLSMTAAAFDSVELIAISRDNSSNYVFRGGGSNQTFTQPSQTPHDGNIGWLSRLVSGDPFGIPSNARAALGFAGPNLNGAGELAELDAALTEWKNALAAA